MSAEFENGASEGLASRVTPFRNGAQAGAAETISATGNLVNPGDTINIMYAPNTGTISFTYSSNPADTSVAYMDSSGPPLAIRHVFARVSQSGITGNFKLCGDSKYSILALKF